MIVKRMLYGIAWLIASGIGALLVLAGLTYATFLGGVPVVIAIASFIIAGGVFLIVRKIANDGAGLRTIVRTTGDQQLHWHTCTSCTDGVQILIDGFWRAIPDQLRVHRRYDTVRPLNPSRPCPYCQATGKRLLAYPPRINDPIMTGGVNDEDSP